MVLLAGWSNGWKLGTPWRFSMRETIVEDPCEHILYPKAAPFFLCFISALQGGGSSPRWTFPGACLLFPRAPGSRGGGRWPRLRICSEARKSVPLEPISPIRNALRPRRLPEAAALSVASLRGWGSTRGERRLGASQHCPSAALPQTAGARTGLGADPTLRLRPRSQGDARARAGRGTRNQPEAWPPAPRRARKGAPFPWDFRIHFRPSKGREGSGRARAPWIGNGSRPCPPAPAHPPPEPARTFNSSEPRPAQGCGRAGPSPRGGGRSLRSTEEGPSDPPRSLSAGERGTERRRPDSRFPELLLRTSVLTAVPGNQRRNCHSPPPSAPAVPASSSHSFLPPPARPAPPRRSRAVRHGVTPTGPARAALGRAPSVMRVRPALA